MKRKIAIILAAMLIGTTLPITTPTYADSENKIEEVKTALLKDIVKISVQIHTTKYTQGITAGDTFYLHTGDNNAITAINDEYATTWQIGSVKYPEKVYIKVEDKIKEIKDGKVDIKEAVKAGLQREGVSIDVEEAIIDIGPSITITKTKENEIKIHAITKAEIQQKLEKTISDFIRTKANIIQKNLDTQNEISRDLKKKTLQTLAKDAAKNIIKYTDSVTQFGIDFGLRIRFDKKTGMCELFIEPADSTVSRTRPYVAFINEIKEGTRNIDVTLKDKPDITQKGENKLTFTLEGRDFAFLQGESLTMTLPKNFTWKESYVKNDKAEIIRNRDDRRQMVLYFQKYDDNEKKDENREDKITFTASIDATVNAKPGYIPLHLQAARDDETTIYIGEYVVEEKKPYMKRQTIFKIGDKQIIKKINDVERKEQLNAAPYATNGKTMLPIRYVADAIDVPVNYNNNTKIATFTKGDLKLKIDTNNKDTVRLNGQEIKLTTPIENKKGTIFVPLTDIAQIFKLQNQKDIIWNQQAKTVTINIVK